MKSASLEPSFQRQATCSSCGEGFLSSLKSGILMMLAGRCRLAPARGRALKTRHDVDGGMTSTYEDGVWRREHGDEPRPSTAPGQGVFEWNPEGLYDNSVFLIPNTDEILKLVKEKMN